VRFRRLLALAALASCVLAVPARFVAAEDPPASKKPQSRPASSPKAPQTQTAPAPAAQSQSQGGVTVLENYYLDLPGFDLSTLTPRQKKKFLDRVNLRLRRRHHRTVHRERSDVQGGAGTGGEDPQRGQGGKIGRMRWDPALWGPGPCAILTRFRFPWNRESFPRTRLPGPEPPGNGARRSNGSASRPPEEPGHEGV
jgi:hypothetical protein